MSVVDLEKIRILRELLAAAQLEYQRAEREMHVARIIIEVLLKKLDMAG